MTWEQRVGVVLLVLSLLALLWMALSCCWAARIERRRAVAAADLAERLPCW